MNTVQICKITDQNHEHKCKVSSVNMTSKPMRGSNDVGDTSRNLKERFFIKPQPMGECAREPGKNSPHCHKEIVQSNENSNGNLEVMHFKIPLKFSS